VESQADYRAPLETLARKFVEAGQDAQRLLGWLAGATGSPWAHGKRVELLRRVFDEQFEVSDPTALQPRTKEQLASERVQNPHEPEATYGCKGRGEQRKDHVGYKVQVAETVCEATLAPGEPTRNFLVGILTHAAREGDEEGGRKMEAEQAAMGLEKPSVNYVDAAYVSAEKLVQAAAEARELIGPALPSPNNNGGRFQSDDFAVQVETRRATCPAGHANSQCSRLVEKATGRVAYRFEWDTTTCAGCPLRLKCIQAEHPHRSLVVGEHHTVLQTRRQEQQTSVFKARMKHRNAIEGTQSELVRAHGMRRARYRGLAKTKLQNYFTGAACNVKRWLRRVAWEMRQGLPTTATHLAAATN
jgi:transposase